MLVAFQLTFQCILLGLIGPLRCFSIPFFGRICSHHKGLHPRLQQRRTGRHRIQQKHHHDSQRQNHKDMLLLCGKRDYRFRSFRSLIHSFLSVTASTIYRTGASSSLCSHILPANGSALIGSGQRIAARMLWMLDFLFSLEKVYVRPIKFLFSIHQLLVIVLQCGLPDLPGSMQGTFAGLLRSVKGPQPGILFLILSDLTMNFRRERFHNNVLTDFSGRLYICIINKQ